MGFLLSRITVVFLFLLKIFFACAPLRAASPREHLTNNSIKHVMVIVFENANYKDAKNEGIFATLAAGGTSFTKMYAITHPSQPNYIAMVAGSKLGIESDSIKTVDARNLADLLEEHGKTWKVYVEAWPGNCFLGEDRGEYVRRHNPLISFKNIQNSPTRCSRIVSSEALMADLANNSLPDLSFYVPGLKNSGHDTNLEYAARWYKRAFGPLLTDSRFTNGMLLITTFDESDLLGGNHIYTSFWGPGVKSGVQISTSYNHYSLLRTIEDIFDLGTLGRNDAKAVPMQGWR